MKIQNPNFKTQNKSQPQNPGSQMFWIWKLGFGICFGFWILSLGFSPSASASQPQPVWATYGLLINDTPGNTPQQNPRILSDDEGGYILVWEDGRAGYQDIYAQKIDESGKSLWAKNGAAVCAADGNQNFPQLVSGGRGEAIIVWQDYRNGNSDIFAQKMDYAGAPLWQADGVAVCKAPAGQFAPQLIPDGSGGAIIVWHDYRSGKGEDIYAQRVDASGNPLWEIDGVPISTAPGTQWYPQIASDGSGGAILVWADGRASSSDNNIYAQRVDPSGNTLWEKDGKPVCSADSNQERPMILLVDGGAIVAWNDSRGGNADIYAQKIDLEGNANWQKDGVAACSFPYTQQDPKLAPDGAGGVIVVWADDRVEESDIYGQRIYNDGSIAWQENGRPICWMPGKQKNPQIVKLKTEDWFVVWEDERYRHIDLFSQKINNAGTPVWPQAGVPLAATRKDQESPVAALTPAGNVIVGWKDNRLGNYDIYAQKISPEGSLLWKGTGVVVCAAPGSVVQQNIDLVPNGKGEIIIVFEDARSGFINIYAQKVTKAGQLAWGEHGIAIAKVSADQRNPRLVPDGQGGAIVVWEDHRIEEFPAIRAQHLNLNGRKIWESSLSLARSKSRQINPAVIADGEGGAIVIWQDDRDVLSLLDIYGQRVSGKGDLLWGKNGKIVMSANGDQVENVLVPDGSGGAYLIWTDYRRGDRNPDIYAQRIDKNGKPLWDQEGVLVCGAPDVQQMPKLISAGEDGIVVAWTDRGGGSYDIYAQRVDKSGRTVWMRDGIPINQVSRTQQSPKFGNPSVLVWEDYRFGNWDIFAGAVDSSGKLLWGEEGIPVALLPQTQYAPQIIPWKRGSVIIAWEDYRSAKHYELYIQQLDEEGKPVWAENGIKILSKDGGRAPKILATYSDNSFYIFWEDYAGGGKAIYGQRYLLN